MIFKNNNFRNYYNTKKILTYRALIAFFFILAVLFTILINIYYLQVVRFKEYKLQSIKNHIKLIPIAPVRGTIYDRNGIPLAINRISYQIAITSKNTNNLNKTILNLRNILHFTDSDLKALQKDSIANSYFNDVPIKRKLNKKQLSYFTTKRYLFPGIIIKKYQTRYYPFGSTLTHVIGYVSNINDNDMSYLKKTNKSYNYIATKNIGKLGIEAYYEDLLHGEVGFEEVEVNSSGNKIRKLNKQLPMSGNDIYLTIDLKLQQYIEKLILNKGRIAVVASNPQNGEILAMVSIPSYDGNLFVNGISSKAYNILLKNKDLPLYNRAIQAAYPPASTVKPYIALTALDAGIITKNTTIFDPGWWKMPGSRKYYRDWKKLGHGNLNITKSIEESSDTFFYQIAYNMGIDYISKWMTKFGFGQYTGIDLPQENKGNMPTRNWKTNRFNTIWYQGDTVPIGIGQGYWTATPLQMNKAMIILINNGVVKVPHVLRSIGKKNSKMVYNEPFSMNVIHSNSDYWNIIKDGMYGVANRLNGTVHQSFVNTPYKAAAKSGTAQVFSLRESEIYNSRNIDESLRDHKLMNAFAPYDKPRIAVTIIMENTGNYKIGSIMRQILDYFMLNKIK
ncbi:penicillin-binding protein 2 [Candidatus Pantoea edessiphila]|uniref:Peptidoglycan D,D-transpeptidase MrdA n=2 Tax=Candidatus Pantoea edessiphila TaxID=2044610 RepID=A0A2P5T0G8_9GAMM|nr:penicillin-binding protein 2 [Candidatus Pantoea edessiphila]PPI88042.1 penicillin-binding protein 2 [Candidatus Pantoea edessiphila]